MRKTLTLYRKGLWAMENLVRAKFYMGLILQKFSYHEYAEEAALLLEEARAGLKELLPLDYPAFLKGRQDDNPLAYDYLVPWTYRVAVETRRPISASSKSSA